MNTMIWTGKKVIPMAFFGLLASAIQAQQTASIVYGSYSSLARAEASRSILEQKLVRSLAISKTEIRDKTFFRVIGPANENIPDLRTRLMQVKADIEPDAWLLIGNSDATPAQAAITPNTSRKDSPMQARPTSAYQESSPASKGPQDFAEISEDSATVSNPFLLAKELTRVARVTDPLTNVIRIKPAATGGVDATTEPLHLPKYDDALLNMRIDGHLDETVWSEIPGYDNMTILEPDTLEVPRYSTVTKLVYTDKGLYVGIWNEQPTDKLLLRLTKRDDYINRDGNHVTLDTSGEGLYGFWFEVALGGAVTDGKVLPEMQYSMEWDGPWYGNSVATEDGYTTEMFLPWSMMAMPDADQQRTMGFYTSRKVAFLDERWGWPSLPMTGSKFMSALQPITLESVNPRQQYALFPFTSTTYDNLDSETGYRTGVDISWRPSSNIQITASLNPDFGTVESDNVVINLTAVETFFPEKRLFFLEGNEIFVTTPRSNVRFSASSSGSTGARATKTSFNPTPTTLVNTRRIGGQAPDPDIPAGVYIPDVELGKPTELMGAFKITGQSGQFRYGILTAFEEDQRFHGIGSNGSEVRLDQDGRNFGVLRFLYENTNNGRKGIGWISTAVTHADGDAYVHGIDTHYLSPSSQWRWDTQLIYSDVDDSDGYGGFTDITYIPSRGIFHKVSFDYLDENLNVDAFGFVRRNDVIMARYVYNYMTSDLKKLRDRSNSWIFNQEYNIDGRVVRSGIFWRTGWTFNNRLKLRTELAYFPRRWDDLNSEDNGEFRTEDRWASEIGIGTDSSKKLSVSFAAGMRQEELGDWTRTAKGGFTYKPNDRLSFDLDFSYFRHDGWLLHQEDRLFTTFKASNWQPSLAMDVFLTARQQLRFTLQWAGIRATEQDFYQVPLDDGYLEPYDKGILEPTDNFTISRITSQLRYRWEIAPLSDLFIVYTRGSNRETRRHDDFEDLFLDSITDPLIDLFVVKLRYRFGT